MIVFEITKNYVKAVWGKNVLRDFRIDGFGCKALSSDSQEELTKVISSIMDEKTYKKYKPLVISIPRNLVILRNLKFPAKNDTELDSIVLLHLTQEVPYAREEIVYNYEVIGRDHASFSTLVLSIVHRRTLVKLFSAFEAMNMYPDNVYLSTFGILQAVNKRRADKDDDKIVACLDIGDEYIDFGVFRKNRVLFSKNISVNIGQASDENTLIRFAGDLKQAMVVFQTEHGIVPEKIYISGIRPLCEKLNKSVSEIFGVPVEEIDISSLLGHDAANFDLNSTLSRVSMTSVSGLFVGQPNDSYTFVLPEAKLRRDAKRIAKNLLITGGTIAYIIVLLLSYFIGKIYSREIYIGKLQEITNKIDFDNRQTVKALDKIKTIREFTKYDSSFLFYYYALSGIVPPDITVDRIVFAKDKDFSVIGRSTDMGGIYRFVREINDAKMFGKCELRYSRKKEEGESEFDIKCRLK